METLRSEYVKARKQYHCDYCGNVIEKGRTYHRSVHKFDNRMYVWRCHTECYELAGVIWDLVDPDEGTTADEFVDMLREVADHFVCPECPYHDNETEDCDCSLDMKCIEHIHAFFQEHELVREKPWVWRLVEKQKAEDMSKTLKENEVEK